VQCTKIYDVLRNSPPAAAKSPTRASPLVKF